jgi:hypothetical protein
MDTIEQTLVNIEAQMEDAITKQKLTVANTIHNVARDSVHAGYSLDMEFMNVFPELKDLCPDILGNVPRLETALPTLTPAKRGKKVAVEVSDSTTQSPVASIPTTIANHTSNVFNPKFVIEVRNNQGVGVIEQWDSSDGILPNRKVMGKYYIDVGKPTNKNFSFSAGATYCISHNMQCNNVNGWEQSNNNPSNIGMNCGCKNFHNNMLQHTYGAKQINAMSIRRGEHRDLFDTTTTHEFEVDNYLNLFHPCSGLYLLFNKTAFPAFPFLARPNIFQSKRHHHDPSDATNKPPMKFEFNNTKYTSRDSRAQVLAAVTELIPDDYYKVIDFYDRFRKMTAFKQGLPSGEPSSPPRGESGIDPESVGPDGKTPTVDTRDKLIRELETRLSGALKQIELTDSYNNELVTIYQKQTAELMDATRKLNQLTANQATETARHRLEDNAQVFTLKKQLADAQACIVRSRIQGDDLARLETELSETQNEVTKYKELNQGLTDQLLAAKRDLKTKAEESANSVLAKNRGDIQINTLQAEKAKLQGEITTLTARIKELDSRLLTVSSSRPDKDALEQVLTARCEELALENKTHVDSLAKVQRELAQVQKDYDAFRGQLTRMMTSAK